jgi:hypothetical protein
MEASDVIKFHDDGTIEVTAPLPDGTLVTGKVYKVEADGAGHRLYFITEDDRAGCAFIQPNKVNGQAVN